jgi:N-methylhydantoinase A
MPDASTGKSKSRYRISADIGGTFTDVVVQDLRTAEHYAAKVLTTPENLSKGILVAFRTILDDFAGVEFAVHGTTQGLNALLSRSGDRVLLLVTKGLRDSHLVMRGSRPREDMYNNKYQRQEPLVMRRDTLGIGGRLAYDGSEVAPLSREDLEKAALYAGEQRIASIAVCFLFSYKNPDHELRARDILRELLPNASISLSHEVAREWREAERSASTVVDAYVGRIVKNYLASIEGQFIERGLKTPLHVMRSSGGVMTARQASRQPIQTLFSGPVGGTMGGAALAKLVGRSHIICADVGGTSFDVSLVVQGQPNVINQGTVNGLDIILPLVEIHSIGAGGGSIAYIEAGGLRVGPRSAGAVPGPACYGKGGTEPTVTDAQVVLGRFLPKTAVGDGLEIDRAKAEQALANLAARLSIDTIALAEGIIDITNAKMAEAIRKITIERGIEPKDFSIAAFGGAGPMHAASLAEELEIAEVLIPPLSGVFSALGMLHAPLRQDLAIPFYRSLGGLDTGEVVGAYEQHAAEAVDVIAAGGIERGAIQFRRFADMRYEGQEYTLTAELTGIEPTAASVAQAFHSAYRRMYGHAHEGSEIEIVSLRLVAIAELGSGLIEGERPSSLSALKPRERPVVFNGRAVPTAIYDSAELQPGHEIAGPAIVDDTTATTVVPPGAMLRVGKLGVMSITFNSGSKR